MRAEMTFVGQARGGKVGVGLIWSGLRRTKMRLISCRMRRESTNAEIAMRSMRRA